MKKQTKKPTTKPTTLPTVAPQGAKAGAVATVEPVKVALTDDQAANAIRKQYQVVIRAEAATFRERVRFGGMLLQWERFLGEARGGKGGTSGDGLKGWLEKNCPELGYAAAMAYKTMAERAIKMLGGGAVVTAALLGEYAVEDPSGEVVAVDCTVRRKADEFFEKADSRRKLEQMWFEFTNGEGERPKKKKAGVGQLVTPSLKEAAKSTWNIFMQKATHHSLKDTIPLLGEKETQVCHDGLMDLLSLLKKHLKEF